MFYIMCAVLCLNNFGYYVNGETIVQMTLKNDYTCQFDNNQATFSVALNDTLKIRVKDEQGLSDISECSIDKEKFSPAIQNSYVVMSTVMTKKLFGNWTCDFYKLYHNETAVALVDKKNRTFITTPCEFVISKLKNVTDKNEFPWVIFIICIAVVIIIFIIQTLLILHFKSKANSATRCVSVRKSGPKKKPTPPPTESLPRRPAKQTLAIPETEVDDQSSPKTLRRLNTSPLPERPTNLAKREKLPLPTNIAPMSPGDEVYEAVEDVDDDIDLTPKLSKNFSLPVNSKQNKKQKHVLVPFNTTPKSLKPPPAKLKSSPSKLQSPTAKQPPTVKTDLPPPNPLPMPVLMKINESLQKQLDKDDKSKAKPTKPAVLPKKPVVPKKLQPDPASNVRPGKPKEKPPIATRPIPATDRPGVRANKTEETPELVIQSTPVNDRPGVKAIQTEEIYDEAHGGYSDSEEDEWLYEPLDEYKRYLN